MSYPSTVREIEDGLGALAAAHPSLVTRTTLPNATHEGRRVSAVRVTNGGTTPVLFIGGAHAREWVPPDALLTLLQRLLDAYENETDLEIPAFTDTAASPTSPMARCRSRPPTSSESSSPSSCTSSGASIPTGARSRSRGR